MSDHKLPQRMLGRTGLFVPVLGYGTGAIGFGHTAHRDGVALIQYAMDQGVTYLDTAHFYESERMVGDAIAGRRDEVLIATKTTKRNYDTALRDIRTSLELLGTDRIDVLMFHCVNTLADLDAVLASDGPMKAVQEARKQGTVRFVGITGHARPNILALALERYPFDVVMSAMGAIDSVVSAPELFLVPTAKRAGCGLVAMKVLGSGKMAGQTEL